MKKLLLFLNLLSLLLAVNALLLESKKETIFLDENKDPFIIVRQSDRNYGTSILKEMQNIAFEIENRSDKDLDSINVEVMLFDKKEILTIDELNSGETKELFFAFKDIRLWKNSQKEKLYIKLSLGDKTYKTTQDIILNKGILRAYFSKKVTLISLDINNDTLEFNPKFQSVFMPLFSNEFYSLKVVKNNDSRFLLNIDDRFVMDSANVTNMVKDIFNLKITKVQKSKKELIYFDFTIPEIVELNSSAETILNLKYAPKEIQDINDTEIISDNDNYQITLDKQALRIKAIKKTTNFTSVSLQNKNKSLFGFYILPTIKHIFKANGFNKPYFFIPKSTQIYGISNKPKFQLKRDDTYPIFRVLDDWILFKGKYSNKVYEVKKSDVFLIVGDGSIKIKATLKKNSEILATPKRKKLAVIPQGSSIEGDLRKDGWIKGQWWIHAKNLNLELKFLLKEGFNLRDKPWGQKIAKVEKTKIIQGRFFNDNWIEFEEDGKKYYIHINGAYILQNQQKDKE